MSIFWTIPCLLNTHVLTMNSKVQISLLKQTVILLLWRIDLGKIKFFSFNVLQHYCILLSNLVINIFMELKSTDEDGGGGIGAH